jgi:hypothetical protein
MAVGFSSPLFLLGISRSAVEVTVGRGAGPLPISIGVTDTVVTVGKGAGPLPLHMGAIGIYSPPITPDKPYVVQGSGWLPRGWVDRRHSSDTSQSIIQDDNEIMELLANILPIIIG